MEAIWKTFIMELNRGVLFLNGLFLSLIDRVGEPLAWLLVLNSTCGQQVGPDYLGYAPGLGYAAFGFLGGVAVEYFRDAADAAVCGQMAEQRQDELGGFDLAFPAELVDL